MTLTVPELARAVGKNDNYVRQHIHRQHLRVRRKGRFVTVELDEAARWAAARGLAFTPPERAGLLFARAETRIARLTVLFWISETGEARNLFTLLRHRDRDAVGPWSGEPDATWWHEPLSEEIHLVSFNSSYADCDNQINGILTTGKLRADDREIHYGLEGKPRNHWAYRDHRHRLEASIRSPFATHSAAMTEYWSFVSEPQKRWLCLSDPLPARLEAGLRRLGFALDKYPERVGNLIVAAAEDAITCRLTAHQDQTLRLHVEAKDWLPEKYRATVWASHSGDEVLRREVPIAPGQVTIELVSDVDRTGFAVCRSFDGQCVDLVESTPTSEMLRPAGGGNRSGLRVREPGRRAAQIPNLSGPVSTVPVYSEDYPGHLDRGIRQQWLRRVAYQREAGARRNEHLVRFGPGRFRDAARHFLNLLSQNPDQAGPIYLADPCFVGHTMAEDVAELFVDMCAAVQRRPLRILCAEREPDDSRAWWAQHAKRVAANVTVRTFVNRSDERGCFHDRYLITPTREILMTNSFNGWNKYGVTLVSLPYGVYRAEAEELWAKDPEVSDSDILVREIS